jgi:uncharacterized protein YecE (DUF72 family)
VRGAFIGTSGWNYKHWRGDIYPAGFAARRWLDFMAERFDTVEVNTSFYRIPKPETVDSWQRSTPGHFRFALKLWRGITHYRKLRNSGDLTRRFLESAEMLPDTRRAPLLIQLPPNQGPDLPKIEDWVGEFRSLTPTRWQLAFEFRNDAWLANEGLLPLLDRLGAALRLHDMHGKAAASVPGEAKFVYVRRHGSDGGRYAGSYSPEQIEADAAAIREWNAAGREVFVYYNNDIGGHAFRNALSLKAAIGSAR